MFPPFYLWAQLKCNYAGVLAKGFHRCVCKSYTRKVNDLYNVKLGKAYIMSGSGVPHILLIDEKGEHQGVQGSYCWGGICVDYAKPSSRTKDIHEHLAIPKGATITFKVVDHISPEQLHVTIFSGDKIVLHEAVKMKMKIKIPRGTYFLNVKATWAGQGDVSNVFLIEVL